jgi:hypothetical protein
MRLLLAMTTALVIGSGAANAACSVEDLEGDWAVTQTNRQEICSIAVDDNGEFRGTCRTYKDGKTESARTAKGVLRISEACLVTGRLTKGDKSRSISARADIKAGIIVGTFFRQAGFIAYRND